MTDNRYANLSRIAYEMAVREICGEPSPDTLLALEREAFILDLERQMREEVDRGL